MQYQFEKSIGRITQELSRNIGELLVKKFAEKGYSITTDEWIVVVYLAHYKKLNQQNIAIHSRRDKVAIKRILDNLQDCGYIQRKVDEKDKRSNITSLTPKGKILYKTLEPVAGDTLEIAYKDIPEERIQECIDVMNLMQDNISRAYTEND